MIRPNIHNHPDQTVIYAVYCLLKKLMKQRTIPFEEGKQLLSKEIEGGELLYFPALSLLFIIGKIEYHPKNDSIEYITK